MRTIVKAEAPIARRIEACEAIPYHLSLAIQPHGALVAIDPLTYRIVCYSENLGELLGAGAGATSLLSVDVRNLLQADSIADLSAFIQQGTTTQFKTSVAFSRPEFVVDAVLYRSNQLVCIEFELSAGDAPATDLSPQRFLQMVERIAQAEGPSQGLSSIACEALRAITGFNRTYYCMFDDDGHGHVLGESRDNMLPSLLDHRFPATDIPQAARQMLASSPFRLIPDAKAIPVSIVGKIDVPLDLTLSTCRAVAESHIQYIRNMGVSASFSFPVVRDGKLSAIFGGHHAEPRCPSLREMAAGRHLVDVYKSRYDAISSQEVSKLLSTRLTQLYALAETCKSLRYDLNNLLASGSGEVCALVDADDIISRIDGTTRSGRLLKPAAASELLDFLEQQAATGVFHSDCLEKTDPRFADLAPEVAGVLAISFGTGSRNTIVWLRSEKIFEQKWSGNPHAAATIDERGVAGPRTSFLAYRREVKGTSLGWPAALVELAQHARQVFTQLLASFYESLAREAAERSNAVKSEFVANVSHELRSPLHSILGFADLLASTEDDLAVEKRKMFAGAIQSSGQRLLHLINDLLDLAKLEAGKFELAFADTDIRHIVDTAISEVAQLATPRSLQILVDDRRLTRTARFDMIRMSQVMVNLLSNAIKFSPRGGTIVISIDSGSDAEQGRWRLEVADEGVGVPDNELDLIFDKFTQGSSTKNGAGGTGLGLSIGREIVKAHHGRIWAERRPVSGARFIIDLPNNPELIRKADQDFNP